VCWSDRGGSVFRLAHFGAAGRACRTARQWKMLDGRILSRRAA
jgi:hypothetical protein